MPDSPDDLATYLKDAHLAAAARLQADYLDDADLIIDDDGVPTLKGRHRTAAGRPMAPGSCC
ncbi:hypothetical protein [Nonomuraea ceibae]|uniref:hypothetical protein n=1 Tax=Nonomuraea ceibae TaxID=1935170 RepID=UPI001C5D4054|nr:hypothetical protein [Nonomuraea ceibae]